MYIKMIIRNVKTNMSGLMNKEKVIMYIDKNKNINIKFSAI